MLKGIANIRGIAQGFLRRAVGLGQKVTEAYWTLRDAGLGYKKSVFESDYEKYDKQDFVTEEITRLDPHHLIPGNLHVESVWDLTANYKYDIEGVYTDLQGNTQTATWSVIDNRRLTQAEIADVGVTFAEDYAPEGFEFVGDITMVGSWTKTQREGQWKTDRFIG